MQTWVLVSAQHGEAACLQTAIGWSPSPWVAERPGSLSVFLRLAEKPGMLQVGRQGGAPCLGSIFLGKEWHGLVSPRVFDAPNEGKCLPLPDGQVLLLALSMLFPYGNRGSSSPEKNRGKRPNFGP